MQKVPFTQEAKAAQQITCNCFLDSLPLKEATTLIVAPNKATLPNVAESASVVSIVFHLESLAFCSHSAGTMHCRETGQPRLALSLTLSLGTLSNT
jgi:hypothetical protein